MLGWHSLACGFRHSFHRRTHSASYNLTNDLDEFISKLQSELVWLTE
jgi:hypothetical protein